MLWMHTHIYTYINSALYFQLFIIIMRRKRVVPNWQLGLKPNKKEVEDLAAKDASDNSGLKIIIDCKFSKDEIKLQKWIKVI